ncbi:MAG: DUF3800 domain-containing protein [Pseudomonadota bacterium]
MHLIYFDETKFSKENPFFLIGGILVHNDFISGLEDTLMQIQYNFFGTNILSHETEFHGQHIFNGIGYFRKRKLEDRVKLFQDIGKFICDNQIAIRIVCIDIHKHRARYQYPQPEYNLGLMLILERFCDFLESKDDIGLVFGDYEKDEITKSILDFSQFKHSGKTSMFHGRPLGRLKDTIYFTHSHHSRFLQVADMIMYMANRYENGYNPQKWHDIQIKEVWQDIKKVVDCQIQIWPHSKRIGETSS